MSKGRKIKRIEKEFNFYVDFYDAFDGWGKLGFWEGRKFEDFELAVFKRDELNKDLHEGNRKMGEYYAVIDAKTGRVINKT